jgi:hypothetical protein
MKHAFVFLALIALPGCSLLPALFGDPLSEQVSECLVFDGSPEYTRAGDARTFKCTRE